MKFLIILAIIASAVAQNRPIDGLFEEAWNVQHQTSPRQQLIDNDITRLRESMTEILEDRTNKALTHIEENLVTILELEKPYLDKLNAEPVQNSCINNIRNHILELTDFTGFTSSLCVQGYDTASADSISDAQEFIAEYEGLFVRLQKVVVEAFAKRNPFIYQPDIIERFNTEFEQRKAQWDAMRPQVEDFAFNFNADLEGHESTMDQCMSHIRDQVVRDYDRWVSMTYICE
jgi:hypothetical protein